MAIKVRGYAAHSETKGLMPIHFDRRELRPNDVLIQILYTGVCRTDLHISRNDWKNTTYPVVPGHEIVGIVTDIGSKVTLFEHGDFVGVGRLIDSCQKCSACSQRLEQYCEAGPTLTYNDIDRHDQMFTYGGYSSKIVISEKFILKLPDELDLTASAPLLCAGITAWSPLRRWKVGKDSRIAVVGLGGLGHMALKLAKALGAHVTLFTSSENKKKGAVQLGADKVVLSSDIAQMSALEEQFELIIDTIPFSHNLNPYILTLRPEGILVVLGNHGKHTLPLSSPSLTLSRKVIWDSTAGGIAETQELLDFCGENAIAADVEVIRMKDINNAYERMFKNSVNYRFVIDMSTLND